MARRRNSTEKAILTGGVVALLIWALVIIGWLMNTWKCVANFLAAPAILEAPTVAWVQLLGVFTGPVGSVMGFFIW